MPSRTTKLSIVKKNDRRSEVRTRIEPLPASVSDLYRERLPVQVVNVSGSGLGIKSTQAFKANFPVLIECVSLLIVANVRHCLPTPDGSYLLGLEVHRTVDLNGVEVKNGLNWLLTFDRRVRTAV